MNLIDGNFEPKKVDNSKKTVKIILITICVVIVAIIGIFIALVYMENTTLKLYIDGNINEKVKEMMVTESDGTIYLPIKDIASHLGYESFSGEYSDKSEDASKCYVQCEDEVANFSLNSNKIYKLTTSDSTANYEYYYTKEPVKAINGKLYATTDAIENAFNISFTYDEDKQRIYIYTMPYLIESYSSKILDYGYETISENFTNGKTILNNMLVVSKNQEKNYGVIDTQGNSIIEAKYDNIEYLPNSGDFLVESNNKVGIISAKKETKIQILYDNLELIDSDAGLYLAEKENKYGVIDSKGNIKIYIEYDQIGIDNTKFEKNDIKNKYLLDNGMILAKKDKLWGAFDKNGNTVLEFEYDSFGYIASSNKDAINLLIIPEYNVLVACKDKKYTLINSSGEELCLAVLDDVYMTIDSGKKHYYMNYSNKSAKVEDFLDEIGVKATNKSGNNSNTNNTATNNTANNTTNSKTNSTTTENQENEYEE
ncbi:MAG: WG repeat-containing protein [Clostridia bacterium]|nr:WG repeat-containing protein [Clostridia bacterium]